MNRRRFLLSTAAASALACSSSPEAAEAPAAAPTTENLWGGDVTLPDAADQLRKAVEQGAIAFGELKKDVMADGPELQRCYALAAELDVPIVPGGGTTQRRNPAATRLAGKCVARDTLAVLKNSTTPEVFRKLTWENARWVYKIV